MTNLLYKEENYAIVGAAMEVYNQFGHGFLEAVYQEALAIELQDRNILFEEQAEVIITYKNRPLRKKYVADYLVYNKIIVEIKAIKQLGAIEEAQLFNYLKGTGLRLGLLINFGNPKKLEWKRIIH